MCIVYGTERSTYLHLLTGCDGTEDNFSKVLCGEGSEADPSDHPVFLDEGQRVVLSEGGRKGGEREGGINRDRRREGGREQEREAWGEKEKREE